MKALRSALGAAVNHPAILPAAAVLLFAGSFAMDAGTLQICTFLLFNILLVQSINLLTGVAGQISLCQAAFYGVGAYTCAALMKLLGVAFPIAALAGVLAAAAAGFAASFPAGRVRDVYLAMMTLAFGLIFQEVLKQWDDVTGGPVGLSGIPSVTLRNLEILSWRPDLGGYFRLVLVVTAAVTALIQNILRSRYGRAFYAIQASEVAAGSLGIPKAGAKRLAYILSAAIAGVAGALYAPSVGFLGPESFNLARSIEILVIGIVGGFGSLPGQIVSAVVFTFLPEKLQIFSQYQFIIYGFVLAFALTLVPRGLAGLLFRRASFIKRRRLRAATTQAPSAWRGTPSPGPLVVNGLGKRFGGLVALQDVSLAFAPGRIVGLIGPNGSGKSTLINVICGVYRPDAGAATFAGVDLAGRGDSGIAAQGVVRTFQDPRLVADFTVRENLMLGAYRRHNAGLAAAALNLPSALAEETALLRDVEAVLALAGLSEVAEAPLNTLPYGYRRLVEVGRALMADPRAVLLDEPAAGLTATEMRRLDAMIRAMKACGLVVLLVEHHMDFMAALVDDAVVLDRGRVIFQGAFADMRRDAQVVAAYLGPAAIEPGVAAVD